MLLAYFTNIAKQRGVIGKKQLRCILTYLRVANRGLQAVERQQYKITRRGAMRVW